MAGLSFLMLTAVESTDALAKKGKIHACYVTKGSDKGAMRFVHGKRCHRGEKSLSWNKKGQPGPAGQAGPAGPAGGSSQDTIDQLRSQVDQQAARITALETEVSQLGSQYTALADQVGTLAGQITGLGSEFSAFRTTSCGQLTKLTDQSNDLGTALDGIDITGPLAGLGLGFVNPGAPGAMVAFAC